MSRQGVPPHASYLFKHALVQDAAYGTLLREPRRALHSRIAEVFESQLPEIAESQPELLARHCAEAGLIEKAGLLWGRAGLRSLARSALIEAEAQLARALVQIASLPGTPILRREEIKLQVALINAQMHAKGYGAPDTKASLDRARSLIERVEALLALEKPGRLRSHREQCAPPAPEAPPALRPRPQNPHRSRRAQPNSALSYPRFPPYEAFGRRPRVKPRAPAKGRRPKPFSKADVATVDVAVGNRPFRQWPSSTLFRF